VCFSESQRTDNPLDGLTPKQVQACALRFYGDSAGPLPHRLIALRLGVSRPAVTRLINRGVARIRANGYDIADLKAQVRS
jgi:DNA-directed RNA polymerase specialized sigma24 family protein